MANGWLIGGYTENDDQGIASAPPDLDNAMTAAACPNPSWLAQDGRRVYAALEQEAGAVAAFELGFGGRLTQLGSFRSTDGADPCHLVVHAGHCYSANYTSGSVAVHPVLADGSLGEIAQLVRHEGSGPNRDRQEAAHAHQVVIAPDGRLLAVDLGCDTVYAYDIATDGTLSEVARSTTHPGGGPRHLVLREGGASGYLCYELDSTVTAFTYSDGVLTFGEPVDARGEAPQPGGRAEVNNPAEIVLSSSGDHLYVTNRGDDSVAVFDVDGDGSAPVLKQVISSGAEQPRHALLSGDRFYTVNQSGNAIVEFAVEPGSGQLTPTDIRLDHLTPSCLLEI